MWSDDLEPLGLRAFLAGYGLSPSEFEAMRPSLELLQLWRGLSSAQWMLANDRAPAETVDLLRGKLRTLLARITSGESHI